MAIYHLHAKPIQRSQGQSAVASAAYRRAAKFTNEKEDKVFDYTNKQGVIHSEILIPANSPTWLLEMVSFPEEEKHKGSETLWNQIEFLEKRSDAQFAREIEFSLPIELDQEQNILLAREFIRDQFVLRGMVSDWSVHWDEGNPHVHVMLTLREITPEGFGLKNREWNKKEMLIAWREKWSEYANFHLKLHEHNISIDHRSYKDQGIDLIPTVHEGKAIKDMERRGMATEIMRNANEIRQENLQRIAADPNRLFDKMTSQRDVFTGEQLGHELGKYLNDKGNFSASSTASFSSHAFSASSEKPSGILAGLALNNFEELSGKIKDKNVLTPEMISQILTKIEYHESVFSERELAKAISPLTKNAAIFARAVMEIKASNELIYLGAGEDGRDKFTTRKMLKIENEIQACADVMRDKVHVRISEKTIRSQLEKYQNETGKHLTKEQTHAVNHILKPSSVSCIVGRAGTGKSFSLSAAKSVWEAHGWKVQGIALSGIASDGLQKDGINSRTIESFRYALKNKKISLGTHDVIVMDEAGMTDSISMHAVIKAVKEANAKLVLVGDHAQIQPVGPGASFRALIERLGFAEIQTIYRQTEAWQREATVALSSGNVGDALKAYSDHGCIHLAKNHDSAQQNLIADLFKARENNSQDLSQYLVIAHRNNDVDLLNSEIRRQRVLRHEISEGYEVVTANHGNLNIAQGDRLLFLKNDNRFGVKNGRFATIKSVKFTETGKVLEFTVILDGAHKEQKEVIINPKNYNDLAYGYAATVHKVQGVTHDHTFMYVSGFGWDRHLSYVAMSRHRKTCDIYASQEEYTNLETLGKKIGRYGIKDSVLDFPKAFSERRGIENKNTSSILPKHLAERLSTFKANLEDRYERWMNPAQYWQQKERQIAENIKTEKDIARREDARVVAAYVDSNRVVGASFESLQQKLKLLGIKEISYEKNEKEAFDLISGTQEYQTFQETFNHRNGFASAVHSAIERYQRAIEIHGIDLAKLNKEASAHQCYERVQAYQSEIKKGAIVIRDRLASTLMANLKPHYSYLKSSGIEPSQVRLHATAHFKRLALKQMASEERIMFRKVESYQQATKEVGKLWASLNGTNKKNEKNEASEINEKNKKKETQQDSSKKNPLTLNRRLLKQLEALGLERERLASHIIKNRDACAKSLDFFEIGLSKPLFIYKEQTQEEQKKSQAMAESRWYKLQQAAARFELRDRVQAYQKSLFVGDEQSRRQLAHDIMQDTKAHHGAIITHAPFPHALWQAIRQDAKHYEQDIFKSGLSAEQQSDFVLVENYLQERRATAQQWREIFDAKDNQGITNTILNEKLMPFVKESSHGRDALSAQISANPEQYKFALDYFGIAQTSLAKSALAHECRERISVYQQSTDRLVRAQIAKTISENPKAHHGALLEARIAWKQIYQDSNIADRKSLFDEVSVEEKGLLRLISQYQKTNRAAGRTYAKIMQAKASKLPISKKIQQKASRFFAKRDYLAAKISKQKDSLELSLAWGENDVSKTMAILSEDKLFKLNSEKIAKQAASHYERLNVVADWKFEKEDSQESLRNFLKSQKGKTEQRFNRQVYLDFKSHQKSALENAQIILSQNIESYRYALQENNISNKEFINVNKALNALSQNITQLQTLQRNHKQAFEWDEDQQIRIQKAQKVMNETRSIKGTLAERYLREHRGIQGELYSKNLRYHPRLKNWVVGGFYPALVVLARDKSGEVRGVQAIFLDAKTGQKAPLGNNAKLSGGITGEGGLIHPGQPGGKIAFAEGPETALSVAEAHPDWEVYTTFGVNNFSEVPLKANSQSIVLCADNDGIGSNTEKSVMLAVKNLSEKGIDVWLALPDKPEDQQKWDFNDALKVQGVDQVKKDLDNAVLHKAGITQEQLKEEIAENLKILEHSNADFKAISKDKDIQRNTVNENTPYINKQHGYQEISKPIKQEDEYDAIIELMLKRNLRAKNMENTPKFIAERTAWKNNFPDVIVHTTVRERDSHPDYQGGKTGDVQAAFRLANDLISDEMIEKIKSLLGEEKPIVLPVSAIERQGINCIPEAMAKIIAERLDLNTEKSVVQSNIVNHSRARAFQRMAFPATFAGEVKPDQKYLVVDDHVGLGGTLANLKGFIEKNGGSVILMTTLSASHNSQYLAPTIEQINGLKQKHGEALNQFLQQEFGHGINELTRAEAGQLLSAKDVETIRDRVLAATSGRVDEDLRKNVERKESAEINDFARTEENQLAERNVDERSTKEASGNKATDDSLRQELLRKEHQKVENVTSNDIHPEASTIEPSTLDLIEKYLDHLKTKTEETQKMTQFLVTDEKLSNHHADLAIQAKKEAEKIIEKISHQPDIKSIYGNMDSGTKVKFIFDTDLKSLYQKVKSGNYGKEDAQRLACFVGDKASGQAKANKLSQDRSEGRSR